MVAASDDQTIVKKMKKSKKAATMEALPNGIAAEKPKKEKKEKKNKSVTVEEESKKLKRKGRDIEGNADASVSKKKTKKQKVEEQEISTVASDSAESEQFVEVSPPKPVNPLAIDNFRLSESVKGLLREKGIESLFSIQAETLNSVLDGFDLVGRARCDPCAID